MSEPARVLRPPGGSLPPESVTLPGTGELLLKPLAEEVTRRHARLFPDEPERYGEHWASWCVHDNQHLLAWAAFEESGLAVLDDQLGWLAGILDARGYPVERLVADVELGADVVEERVPGAGRALAARLRGAAGRLRARRAR